MKLNQFPFPKIIALLFLHYQNQQLNQTNTINPIELGFFALLISYLKNFLHFLRSQTEIKFKMGNYFFFFF